MGRNGLNFIQIKYEDGEDVVLLHQPEIWDPRQK